MQGIQSSQVKESKQVYRPPGARGTPSSFKLHDDEDEDCNNKPSGPAGQQGNNKDKEDNLRWAFHLDLHHLQILFDVRQGYKLITHDIFI